jgi:hypothetical protein
MNTGFRVMSKRSIAVLMVIAIGVIICGLAWYVTLPTPTPAPTPTPTPTPGASPAPFSIQVISRPINHPGVEGNVVSLAGQRCILLVAVMNEGSIGEAVDISANGPGTMANVTVYPQSILPGQVAEVTVIPSVDSINETLTVTISGERDGIIQNEMVDIEVIPGEDDKGEYAAEMRDMFIPWLFINHPELGITNDTEWTGTIINLES